MSRPFDRVALALLAVAAIVRALFLAETIGLGVDLRARPNVDARLYDHVARAIVAGDVALSTPPAFPGSRWSAPDQPFYGGCAVILGEERWRSAYPEHAYMDSPGYPYLVAAFYAAFGPGTSAVYVAQELLDLAACAAVYLLALRLFDRTIARVALLLVALHGPLVFHAGFLLRDSVIASLGTLALLAAVRAQASGRARSWLVAGGVLGAAWLVKGSFSLLAPFVLVAAIDGTGPSRRSARVGALALGAALAVLPFAVRNVALGVPPLRMSRLEAVSVLAYNIPGAATRGLSFDLESSRRAALRCEELSSGAALRAAIAEHPGPGSWVRMALARVANALVADDPWDNVRYSFLSPCLASLQLAPVRWKLLEPLALVGLALAVIDARRKLLVLAPIVAALAMIAVSVCTTRYRLPMDPFLALLAASGGAWLYRQARARRPRALAVALAAVAGTLALHEPVGPPSRERIAGYVIGTFPEATARRLLPR